MNYRVFSFSSSFNLNRNFERMIPSSLTAFSRRLMVDCWTSHTSLCFSRATSRHKKVFKQINCVKRSFTTTYLNVRATEREVVGSLAKFCRYPVDLVLLRTEPVPILFPVCLVDSPIVLSPLPLLHTLFRSIQFLRRHFYGESPGC